MHAGVLGERDDGICIEAGWIEGGRLGHVFINGDPSLRRVHYPFGVAIVDLVLPDSFKLGIEPEMDEHGIVAVFEEDLLGGACVNGGLRGAGTWLA